MSNAAFEAWWTAHHAEQPETVKRAALTVFEAGMAQADQMHCSISAFLDLDRPAERWKKRAA